MKNRKLEKGERGFVLLLGVISLIAFGLSLSMFLKNPSLSAPGAFPLLTSGIMLLMFVGMVWEMRSCPAAFDKGTDLLQKAKELAREILPGKIPLVLIYVLAYGALLPLIGFPIATYLFLVGSMITLNRSKVISSLIVAAGVLVFILLIFQYIFKVILP